MRPQRAAPTFAEHCKISACLRSFYNSERVFLMRHRQVVSIVASDLEKHSTVWTAFVSLAGRVKKARAKAQAGRNLLCISHDFAHSLQRGLVRLVHLKVCEQC